MCYLLLLLCSEGKGQQRGQRARTNSLISFAVVAAMRCQPMNYQCEK